jgi:hypothetical protein
MNEKKNESKEKIKKKHSKEKKKFRKHEKVHCFCEICIENTTLHMDYNLFESNIIDFLLCK